MKTKSLKAILILAGVLLLFSPISSKADTIYITPDTRPVWYGTTPSEPTAAEIGALSGIDNPDLAYLYKANADPVTYEKTYASSYTASFNADLSGGTISYVAGQPSLSGVEPLYLLVKDGNHDPTWYVFDLLNVNTPGYSSDTWDGTENIVLSGFWTGNGAISNVAILGPSAAVPEPGILILLGIAMSAVGIVSRYVREI